MVGSGTVYQLWPPPRFGGALRAMVLVLALELVHFPPRHEPPAWAASALVEGEQRADQMAMVFPPRSTA